MHDAVVLATWGILFSVVRDCVCLNAERLSRRKDVLLQSTHIPSPMQQPPSPDHNFPS